MPICFALPNFAKLRVSCSCSALIEHTKSYGKRSSLMVPFFRGQNFFDTLLDFIFCFYDIF